MDDLINSFRIQDMDSLIEDGYKYQFQHQEKESPIEDGYIYHFRDGSPANSVQGKSVQPATSASAGPSIRDLSFVTEATASHPATGSEEKNEGDHNADIEYDDNELDTDDDESELAIDCNDNEHGRDEVSQFEANRTARTIGTSYNDKSDNLDGSFHKQDYEKSAVNTRARHDSLDPSSASIDDGEDLEGFIEEHLRRFHRQDLDRDNLLLVRPTFRPLLFASI